MALCSDFEFCVANINSIYNKVSRRFSNFLTCALKSDSPLIQTIYQWASNHTFTAPAFNNLYKNLVKVYTVDDHICAEYIRDIRLGRLTFDSADILNTSVLLWLMCFKCVIALVSGIIYVVLILWYTFLWCGKDIITSGNRTPGSRFYSDLLDTLADSVCIHQLVLKRRSKR